MEHSRIYFTWLRRIKSFCKGNVELRISRFRIKNYMGFRKTEELRFSSAMNLIVGQNNVGKSSLLQALALKFDARPHRSEKTKPASPLNPHSEAEVELGTTGQEIKELMLASGSAQFFIPVPPKFSQSPDNMAELAQSVFDRDDLRLRFRLLSGGPDAVANFAEARYPSHGMFHIGSSDKQQLMTVNISSDRQEFKPQGLTSGKPTLEFGYALANMLRERIYFFHAERLRVARSPFGYNETLQSDSSNLPEVLNMLHSGNPALNRKLNNLVRQIIPTVKWVSVLPIAANNLEIRVWPIEEASERSDLAISLDECGTGVGQVLAMLYVVITSKYPRVILIDEPASFLHPGASRKLISILNQYPQHQYVISTHSPEIIALGRSSPNFLVTSEANETRIEQIDPSQLEQMRRVLIEVGAKLSDVYGADNIVWVEGTTEEECFPLIAAKFDLGNAGTVFRAVLDTGRLQSKRTRESILGIYRRLSQASALLPPALAFVFDREELSDSDIDDLKRHDGVHFIKRRMYENYLIDADAIAEVLNNTETFKDKGNIEPKQIEKLLQDAINAENHNSIDGADILQRLFSEVSEAKEEYRKTIHSVDLTRILLEKDPDRFAEIRGLLEGIFSDDLENQAD